jgi:hypothetical protein
MVDGQRGWQLTGRIAGFYVLDEPHHGSDSPLKKAVTGNVVGITVTPVVAPATAAPTAPVPATPSATPTQPVVAPAPTSPAAGATSPAAPVVTPPHA